MVSLHLTFLQVRQDLSCMYLAHHELESVITVIIIIHGELTAYIP